MRYSTPLFQPHTSTIFIVYLIVLHVIAMISVSIVFSGFCFWIFLLLILGSAIYYFFYDASKIIALTFSTEKEWIVQLRDGRIERVTLLGSSVMLRHMIILHFQLVNSKKITALIFSDSMSKIDFQLLRRCVRMGYL